MVEFARERLAFRSFARFKSAPRPRQRVASEPLEERRLLSAALEEGDCGCNADGAPVQSETALTAAPSAPAPRAPAASAADVSIAAASDDSDDTTPAGWTQHTGWTAGDLNTQLAQGLRLVDIEVASVSPLRFDATTVQNSGSHAKAWWWYYGVDANFVSQKLTENNARLVDIESYADGGQKYAVVMISNTGADAKGWAWYYNVTSTQVGNFLTANNARLTDIDRHNGAGNTFDVIMVNNTGSEARAWWYYYNITPAQIGGFINANNARLVDIEPIDEGHFDVIMEQSPVSAWWWYYGLTSQATLDTAVQNGARVFDIERYDTAAGPRFASVMVNNSNEVTTRVGEVLRQSNATADTGLYLKQVNGPVLADLRGNDRFEPASMIKTLLNLTAMRAVQANQAALTDPLFMYYDPANPYVSFANPGNPDECPDNYSQTASNRAQLSMQRVLEMMMERSDNRATRTIDQRFGRPLINATADLAGMSNTDFASTLGCGVPGNYLTLADAGRMFEGILDHNLLNAANADRYFENMSDADASDLELVPFGEGVFGPFQTVVLEEAAALRGTSTVDSTTRSLANRFIAEMTGAWKGGGYTISSGTNWREIRTAGGYVGLPFWGDGGINVVNYVYGIFIDNATVPKSNPTPGRDKIDNAWSDSQGELLRVEIRKALATWRPTVRQVYVSNSAWTAAYRNYLDARRLGDSVFGYAVPDGANQLDVLPWSVNRVSVRFNQGVSVQSGDLTVRGVNVRPPGYAIDAFTYDPVSFTATWTFTPAAATDRLVFTVDADAAAGVQSLLGLRLDGDWNNGADAYPSGNGAQGGDLRFRVNVLGGDATRDGRVNSLDLASVRQRLNTASTDIGRTLYSAFVDVTGDGRINALDLASVKQRLNAALPATQPTSLFSTRRLDDDASTWALLA